MNAVSLVRATSLAPFLRYVEAQGGVQTHLDAGRVPGELTEQPEAWISKLQVYRVLESVVLRESGEGLGLETGRNIVLADLGPLGAAAARAATLKDACLTFGRLLPQLAQDNTVDFRMQGQKAWFTYTTVDHTVGNRDAADHYGLMILLAIVREVGGPDWFPREVKLQTGTTEAFASDTTWEGTHSYFDQRGTGLAFPAGWLSRPFREGVTYSHLVERVRFGFATCLLQDPKLTVRHIACQLGYSGPNNFIRAFHRIAGCTPGAFRRKERTEYTEGRGRNGVR